MSEKSEWRIDMETQGFSKHEILKAYSKRYRALNTERLTIYGKSEDVKDKSINRHMKKRYGLERTQYNKMIEEQHNQCKICGIEFGDRCTIHIDHSHASGEVRGLLCSNCNTALGHVKDDVDILRHMIEYLT